MTRHQYGTRMDSPVAGTAESYVSAMGCKAESDYNRNVYLDILDYTRQDKELESRFLALEKETGQLNVLLWLVAAGFLVLVVLFVWLNRSWRVKNTMYLTELKRFHHCIVRMILS